MTTQGIDDSEQRGYGRQARSASKRRASIACAIALSIASVLLMAPAAVAGECLGGTECIEPCPAEGSCYLDVECGSGGVCQPWVPGLPCFPSECSCDAGSGTWRCTTDCAGQCAGGCAECGARFVHVELDEPNVVEVCASNDSVCAGTYSVTIELDGPTCHWGGQVQVDLPPGATRCIDFRAPSPCYFEFGLWCVRVELWNEFRLCDTRLQCREFCPGPPPPPMYVSASDGEFCEGVLVTWAPVPLAEYYEVFLNPWPWGDCDTLLGQTSSNHYWDTECEPHERCYYSLRAINPCGVSSCSDIDGGYRAIMFADWEPDCDVDLDDYVAFGSCMTAPSPDGELVAGCQVFNLDHDGDVDLADVAAFQRAFTGP